MSCSNRRWGFVSFKQRAEGLELPSCKWGTSVHSCWNPKLNTCSHKSLVMHRIQNDFWCSSFIHYFCVSVAVCSHPLNKIVPFFSCLAPRSDLTGSRALSLLPCFPPVIFDKSEALNPQHQAGVSVRNPSPCCMELHPFISKCCQTEQFSDNSSFPGILQGYILDQLYSYRFRLNLPH